jgi:hypothetical protein
MNRTHTLVAILACALLPLAMLSVPRTSDGIAEQITGTAASAGLTRVVHDLYRDWLHEGRHQVVGFDLEAQVMYYVVGACDADCAGLHLALDPAAGATTSVVRGTGDSLVLAVQPSTSGRHQVTVTMQQCRLQPCEWGIRVYRR